MSRYAETKLEGGKMYWLHAPFDDLSEEEFKDQIRFVYHQGLKDGHFRGRNGLPVDGRQSQARRVA